MVLQWSFESDLLIYKLHILIIHDIVSRTVNRNTCWDLQLFDQYEILILEISEDIVQWIITKISSCKHRLE